MSAVPTPNAIYTARASREIETPTHFQPSAQVQFIFYPNKAFLKQFLFYGLQTA
jgi:hypothetical protein